MSGGIGLIGWFEFYEKCWHFICWLKECSVVVG